MDRLVQRLAAAEERERKRIADGLHDEVGPLLAAAKLKLTMQRSSRRSPASLTTHGVIELLDQVVIAVRALTFALNPAIASYSDFVAALRSLCVHVSQGSGLPVVYEPSRTPVALSSEAGQVLYRSARRLLGNVVGHAEASLAEVSVRCEVGWVEVEVSDDGAGFDLASQDGCFGPGGGFGLYAARSELASVDGALRIESVVGTGTRARARVPSSSPTESTP